MAELVNSYNAIHLWIQKYHGKADKCEFCAEENKDYEWALKKGFDYARDISHFFQLCVQCHRKYDLSNRKLTEEHKKNIGRAQIGLKHRPRTEEEKAHHSNIMKGKKFPNRKRYVITEEHKKRLSIAAKMDWEKRKLLKTT